MVTKRLIVEVPEELAAELANAEQTYLSELLQRGFREQRIDQALAHYRQGGVSFAAIAETLGMRVDELARFAYARGIEPPEGLEMLDEELA